MKFKLGKKIFYTNKVTRAIFFLVLDSLIIFLSFYGAYYLRFRFIWPPMFLSWLAVFWAVKIFMLFAFRFYSITWSYVGIAEFLTLVKSSIVASSILVGINFFVKQNWKWYALSNVILILDGVLSYSGIGFLRISKRIYMELLKKGHVGKNTLIIGANFKSARLIKELKFEQIDMSPVAIMDNDPAIIGTRIFDLPVISGKIKLAEFIKENRIEAVLINLPEASTKEIKETFDRLKACGVQQIKIVPRIKDWNESLNQIRKIDIEDLLFHEQVQIEFENIRDYLRNRTVLITGAAGSIGSEIVKKLIDFGIKEIVAFEIDETEIFNMQNECQFKFHPSQKIHCVVGDIRDRGKIEWVFQQFKPQIVFHSAAYKHVPLMEEFPEEAVKTNILGTHIVAELSLKYGVEKMINISTDKAVNPTSIMGATKRLAEMICQALNTGQTKMISVRFGNVRDSRGSVIPVFLEQIKKGGPITVTHPDIKRYFMSIPEAVLLVVQAAYMGKGGEVFVLDMGEPVKIIDLAENLIRLNNLEPYKDINIVFSGLRPGEKLFEELLTAEEGTDMTTHSQIFIARESKNSLKKDIKDVLKDFETSLQHPETIKDLLKRHVPHF